MDFHLQLPSQYLATSILAALILGFGIYRILQARILSPLSSFPGPFWASTTNLWRLIYSYLHIHDPRPWVDLQKKYGDVVRLGPNMLSFGSPQAVQDIYSVGRNLKKSEFYSLISPVEKGIVNETVFSTRNQVDHATHRRAVNPAFRMTALLQHEDLIDDMCLLLADKLRTKIAAREKLIDLPRWLQNYAFDTAACMCYSKPYGFLERDVDIDGIISTTRMILDYTSHFGNMPFLDWLFLKNPLMLWLGRRGIVELTTPLVPWAINYQAERTRDWEKKQKLGLPMDQNDLLDTYMGLHHTKPEIIQTKHVTELGLMLGFAGSESVSSALSALIYLIVSHPAVYQRLLVEVNDPATLPQSTGPAISWAKASQLPFFDACVKETFRLHPPPGFIMERVVPPSGASIAGYHVPGGTIVGCSRQVQRDPKLFGADPDSFIPERWLAETDEERQKAKEMWAACALAFGAGAHTCMGKNISLLEIYKLGVMLFKEFQFKLDDSPSGTPKWTYSQFMRMEYRMQMELA